VTSADIEVVWDDQKNINAFGKLNNRLSDLDDEIAEKKRDVENHKDAIDLLDVALDDNAVKYVDTTDTRVHTHLDTDHLPAPFPSPPPVLPSPLPSIGCVSERCSLTWTMTRLRAQ
jgi:hypothetical protein